MNQIISLSHSEMMFYGMSLFLQETSASNMCTLRGKVSERKCNFGYGGVKKCLLYFFLHLFVSLLLLIIVMPQSYRNDLIASICFRNILDIGVLCHKTVKYSEASSVP